MKPSFMVSVRPTLLIILYLQANSINANEPVRAMPVCKAGNSQQQDCTVPELAEFVSWRLLESVGTRYIVTDYGPREFPVDTRNVSALEGQKVRILAFVCGSVRPQIALFTLAPGYCQGVWPSRNWSIDVKPQGFFSAKTVDRRTIYVIEGTFKSNDYDPLTWNSFFSIVDATITAADRELYAK